MSLEGDVLKVENRRADRPAAVFKQPPESSYPALAVQGQIVISGGGINGVSTPTGTAAVGAVQAITATGTPAPSQWVGAANVGPWVFDVRHYGAKGDGQCVIDGAMTSGQNILTCSTSAPFTSADLNKPIMLSKAGATGVTTLVTTIAQVLSASQVKLATNASGTVTGSTVLWGTDDTAAIQAAVNAAVAYGQTCGSVMVYFPPVGTFYAVAGPLVTSSTWNSQITIPIVGTPAVANTQNKVVLIFAGTGNGAATRHWQQTAPTTGGSCIISFGAFASTSAQTASLNAGGQASCIGGPTGANGYGTNVQTPDSSGSVFNNVMPVMSNISVLTTHTANGIGYGALNFHGCCAAGLLDFGYGTTGTHAGGDFNNPVTFANGLVVGVVMPASGNNDALPMRNVTCHGGYTRGIFMTEHTTWNGGTMLYCWSGLCPVGDYGDGGTGTGAFHGVQFDHISVEGCTNILEIIGPGAGGVGPQITGCIDNEGTPNIVDNSFPVANGLASAVGTLHIKGGGGTITTNLGTGLSIINDIQPAGPVAQIALTINTAVQNTYWRPATVTLAGGTVTSVQVGNTMGGSAAPSLTTIYSQSSAALPLMTVRVPTGGWIKVNGSVTPTTNSWVLD